jgi:hypothetical protein
MGIGTGLFSNQACPFRGVECFPVGPTEEESRGGGIVKEWRFKRGPRIQSIVGELGMGEAPREETPEAIYDDKVAIDKDKPADEDGLADGDRRIENEPVEEDGPVEEEDGPIEEEDRLVEEEDRLVEEEDRLVEEEDRLVEEEDRLVEEEDRLVEEEDIPL